MKHILRSPIEPEFAYFVKTTFRKKKAAIQSRLQSDLTRFRAFLLERKKRLAAVLQEGRSKMSSWKKNVEAAYKDRFPGRFKKISEKKQEKNAQPDVPGTEEAESGLFHPDVSPRGFPAPLKRLAGAFTGLRKREWRDGWKSSLESPKFLVGLFVLALIAGLGIKSLARESITIGFDDYKLASSANTLDLNAVQKRVLSGAGEVPAGAPEGAQCTE